MLLLCSASESSLTIIHVSQSVSQPDKDLEEERTGFDFCRMLNRFIGRLKCRITDGSLLPPRLSIKPRQQEHKRAMVEYKLGVYSILAVESTAESRTKNAIKGSSRSESSCILGYSHTNGRGRENATATTLFSFVGTFLSLSDPIDSPGISRHLACKVLLTANKFIQPRNTVRCIPSNLGLLLSVGRARIVLTQLGRSEGERKQQIDASLRDENGFTYCRPGNGEQQLLRLSVALMERFTSSILLDVT